MKRSSTSIPPSEPADSQEPRGQPASIADAFAQMRKYCKELCKYLDFYLNVQIDRMVLSIKMMVMLAAVGLLVMMGLGALLVTASVEICSGIARLLSDAFGGRVWAGDLVTGGIIWIVVLVVAYVVVSTFIARSRQATMEKYEQRRAEQRSELGRDVGQKADE